VSFSENFQPLFVLINGGFVLQQKVELPLRVFEAFLDANTPSFVRL